MWQGTKPDEASVASHADARHSDIYRRNTSAFEQLNFLIDSDF